MGKPRSPGSVTSPCWAQPCHVQQCELARTPKQPPRPITPTAPPPLSPRRISYFDEGNVIHLLRRKWRQELDEARPMCCEGVLCTSRLQLLMHTVAHEMVRGRAGRGGVHRGVRGRRCCVRLSYTARGSLSPGTGREPIDCRRPSATMICAQTAPR